MASEVFFSNNSKQLFRLDTETLAAINVGQLPQSFSDLALSPDGTLYGITFHNLFQIDKTTGAVTFVAHVRTPGVNSLVIDAQGEAYVGSRSEGGIFRIDLHSGRTTTLPLGSHDFQTAGDIAVMGGALAVATTAQTIRFIDPNTGALIRAVHHTVQDLFGLATIGTSLYGFSQDDIYRIDPATGATTLVRDFEGNKIADIYGAASNDYGQSGVLLRDSFDHSGSLIGTLRADVLFGFDGDDRLVGNAGNDTLDGGAGADTLNGGFGSDTYNLGSNLEQVIRDAGGSDTIASLVSRSLAHFDTIENLVLHGNASINGTGNAHNNLIVGGGGNNILDGGAGGDTLLGSEGADILIGGLGRDIMTGGLGTDVFRINSLAESRPNATRDIVTDFTQGADRIDLRGIDANTNIAGNQAFKFLPAEDTPFSDVAGQLRFEFLGGVTLIEGDVNGDSVADFQLRLAGQHPLTQPDFFI